MSMTRTTLSLALIAALGFAPSAWSDDLANLVAGKLRDSGALSGYQVNVKSKSGTVWLEGRVSDEKQLAAAVGIAETTPGVERVVNRLVIGGQKAPGTPVVLGLPSSTWGAAGLTAPEAAEPRATKRGPLAVVGDGLRFAGGGRNDSAAVPVQLAQATVPAGQPRPGFGAPMAAAPRPLSVTRARPAQPPARDPRARMAMRTSGQGQPMMLPGPAGDCPPGMEGQMVPGTMQYGDNGDGGYAGGYGPDGGMGGMGGAPMPMAGTGVGMPPVPMRGDGPNMPNYAWPSYAAYPNYAALQYPTQYSPTAWPYIGPFYPYPQVPLGWRRVSLEWDDGWWWLDFDERHIHSHHR